MDEDWDSTEQRVGDEIILTERYQGLLRLGLEHLITSHDCLWDVIIYNYQGAVSIRKTILPGMAIPMLKIRRPNGRLIFNMEIAIRR